MAAGGGAVGDGEADLLPQTPNVSWVVVWLVCQPGEAALEREADTA